MAKKRTPPAEAFHTRYQISEKGCWLWTGDKSGPSRYGSWVLSKDRRSDGRYRKTRIYAHRLSWELHRGEIPAGMRVLHRCDIPLCVNPAHLFLGTPADNSQDMVAKGRQARGMKKSRSGLKDNDISDIRASAETGAVLADRYGVSFQTISEIRLRKTWRHIP